jgi:hypothetical protein
MKHSIVAGSRTLASVRTRAALRVEVWETRGE